MTIDRIAMEPIRRRMREFQGEHLHHIRDLSALVRQLGGTPLRRPGTPGRILEGPTAVTMEVGTEAALQSLLACEALTRRLHRAALEEAWKGDVRQPVERHFQEELGHLDYLEAALRHRPWAPVGMHP